jgi:ribulose-phosphate 3-epimerase
LKDVNREIFKGGIRMIKIAPSVMCANFLNLEKDINSMDQAGVDFYHIDIMDGHFVPNLSLNFEIIKLIKSISKTPLDVHLMVDDPANYISRLNELGVEYVSFHIEAVQYPIRLSKEIRKLGMKAGIVINPATGIESLQYLISEVDFILFMTVEPGFAGQKFIPQVADKIHAVKKMIDAKGLDIPIQVDGNINEETGSLCIDKGASILVSGTASVFKKDVNLYDACLLFKMKMNKIFSNNISA